MQHTAKSFANLSNMSLRSTGNPNSERMLRLKDKMDTIQTTFEQERHFQFDNIQRRIENLDVKLRHSSEKETSVLVIVDEEIKKLERIFEESVVQRDMDFDQKTRDLKYLEDKVFERFEIDTLERKDLEKKIVNYLDEKTNNLRIELNRELNNRAESINNLKGCLESDLPVLQEAIRAERIEREEKDNEFMKKTQEDLQRVHGTIMEEKKAADETSEAMLEMLREMVNRIKNEIQGERKEREACEDTLLSLMEETCTKLNVSSAHPQSISYI